MENQTDRQEAEARPEGCRDRKGEDGGTVTEEHGGSGVLAYFTSRCELCHSMWETVAG